MGTNYYHERDGYEGAKCQRCGASASIDDRPMRFSHWMPLPCAG